MLEDVANILVCERLLKEHLATSEFSFLGELELTQEDTYLLRDLLNEQVGQEPNNLKLICENFPTSVALFLVNKGIWDYQQGQYWAFEESILDIEEPVLQNRLGNFFLTYIQRQGLKQVEAKGAYRFVSSILLHGGIPQSCLPEFFTEAILPLCKMGIIDEADLNLFLEKIRQRQLKRDSILNEISNLEKELNLFYRQTDKVAELSELYLQFEEYEHNLSLYDYLPNLPADFLTYKQLKLKELAALNEQLEQYEQTKIALETKINLFGSKEQELIDFLPKIQVEIIKQEVNSIKQELSEELAKIYQEPWKFNFELFSDEIVSFYEKYRAAKQKEKIKAEDGKWFNRLFQFIKNLFSLGKKREEKSKQIKEILQLRKTIEETLQKNCVSPIKEELFLCGSEEFAALIKKIRMLTNNYNQRLEELDKLTDSDNTLVENEIAAVQEMRPDKTKELQIQFSRVQEAQKRKREANLAKAKLEKTIVPVSDVLTKRAQSIRRKIAEKEKVIMEIGEGDLEKGIVAIQELREIDYLRKNTRKRIQFLEQSLQANYDLENGGLKQISETISEQVTGLQRLLVFKQEELTAYPIVYPYIDEPIRKFLIYGEDWAKDFVVEAVSLVQVVSEGGNVLATSFLLPRRVINWFVEWWPHRLEIKTKERQVKRERAEEPLLVFEPIYKQLKLVIGKIRFYFEERDNFQGLSLVVSTPDKATVLTETVLRAYYLRENLLEIQPLEINLEKLWEKYRVDIYLNEFLLFSWTISGLEADDPFLVFSEDGRRQEVRKLRKARYWFILNEDVVLNPGLHIVEESEVIFGTQIYKSVLLDLAQQATLNFMDGEGLKREILLLDCGYQLPEFTGGQKINNVFSDGAPVYTGELPDIRVFLSRPDDLSYWFLRIENEQGEALVKTSLSKLKMKRDYGSVILSLQDSALLGKAEAGVYTIFLNYLGQEVSTDHLVYLPGLKVDFEQEIYAPQEKEEKKVKLMIKKPLNTELIVHPPAKVLREEANQCYLEIGFANDSFCCDLTREAPTGERIAFFLTINIPKLKWRLLGYKEQEVIAWSDSLEEFWFADWQKAEDIFLEVYCPNQAGEVLQLYLKQNQQKIELFLQKEKAQFKLTFFNDDIRNSDLAVHEFWLDIIKKRQKLSIGPVLKVRSRWEVYEVVSALEKNAKGYSLKLQWLEKGKAEQKVIRFWNVQEPWRKPYVFNIPPHSNEIILEQIQEKLPAGRYLIHFAFEDPWVLPSFSFPKQDYNLELLDIYYDKIYLQDCQVQFIADNEMVVSGQFFNLASLSKIEVELWGVYEGKVKKIKKQKVSQEGKFEVVFKKERLLQYAHWLVISIPSESFLEVLTLVKGAPLEVFIDESRELLEHWLDPDNINFKLVYEEKNKRNTLKIREKTKKKDLLHKLLEKQDFTLDFASLKKGTKMHWREEERQVDIDLPAGGVICSTCGRLFPNEKAWYEHDPFSKCKALKLQVYTVRGELMSCFNFGEIYKQFLKKYPELNLQTFVLFSTSNSSEEFSDLNLEKAINMLLQKEIILCHKLMEV